jgi:hypothetical protein
MVECMVCVGGLRQADRLGTGCGGGGSSISIMGFLGSAFSFEHASTYVGVRARLACSILFFHCLFSTQDIFPA